MKQILFFGLGHLGSFFINQNENYQITGTKRSLPEKSGLNIQAYSLGDEWDWENNKHYDVIIISFPPVENYCGLLSKLLEGKSFHQKVIFISSTSVFGEGVINENSKKLGTRRNALELIKCEEFIGSLENYVIVRPGGLIDEKRHPRNFFRRTKEVSMAKTPVNLVHTSDVAAFINHIIKNDIKDDDFNLVCDDHPTKKAFYGEFVDDLFFNEEGSINRIISNSKSKFTGFNYKYPNLDWCRHYSE